VILAESFYRNTRWTAACRRRESVLNGIL